MSLPVVFYLTRKLRLHKLFKILPKGLSGEVSLTISNTFHNWLLFIYHPLDSFWA